MKTSHDYKELRTEVNSENTIVELSMTEKDEVKDKFGKKIGEPKETEAGIKKVNLVSPVHQLKMYHSNKQSLYLANSKLEKFPL